MAQEQGRAAAISDAAPEAASSSSSLAFSSAPTYEPDTTFSAAPCAPDTGSDAGAAAATATASTQPAQSAFSQDGSRDISSPGTSGAALQRDSKSAYPAHPGEATEAPAAEAAVSEGTAPGAQYPAAPTSVAQLPEGSLPGSADSAVVETSRATAAEACARTDQGGSAPAAAPSGAAAAPGAGAAQLLSGSAERQQAGQSAEPRAASAGQQRVLLADTPARASQSAPAGAGDAAQRSALSGQPRVLFRDLPGERPGAATPPADAASRHSSAGHPRVLFADLPRERLSLAGLEAAGEAAPRVSAREALDAAEEERTLLVAKNGALQHRIRQACPRQLRSVAESSV